MAALQLLTLLLSLLYAFTSSHLLAHHKDTDAFTYFPTKMWAPWCHFRPVLNPQYVALALVQSRHSISVCYLKRNCSPVHHYETIIIHLFPLRHHSPNQVTSLSADLCCGFHLWVAFLLPSWPRTLLHPVARWFLFKHTLGHISPLFKRVQCLPIPRQSNKIHSLLM